MSVNHYPVPLSAADTISSTGPSPAPPPPQRGCDKLIKQTVGPRSGPTKCLMFRSRNKGADKAVRCADLSSHVTKPGYIHLQTCGKQSEIRDVPIISRALLILKIHSHGMHFFYVFVGSYGAGDFPWVRRLV